jgi:hypothetical protein
MKWVLLILSVLWIGYGVLTIVYTGISRGFMQKLIKPDKMKPMAVVPLLTGIILVIGAFWEESLFGLAMVLGILALAKGAYLFAGPPEQVKAFMDWWLIKASDETMRFFALISFIIGSAVLAFIL